MPKEKQLENHISSYENEITDMVKQKSEEDKNFDVINRPQSVLTMSDNIPGVKEEYGETIYNSAKELTELGFGENKPEEDAYLEDATIYEKIKKGRQKIIDMIEGNYKPNRAEMYQSWSLTKVKYGFTIGEKKVFMKIVDICQRFFNNEHLGKDCYMEVKDLLGTGFVPVITFPIRDILSEKDKSNYQWVKDSLHTMLKKEFGIPGNKDWDFQECVLFQRVMSDKRTGRAGAILSFDFWRALSDLSSYKILNFDVIKNFSGIYGERLYELLMGNTENVTYDISHIREMFCLNNKYKNNGDLINRVIIPAQDEMKKLAECPITFDYKLITGARNKIEKITFIVSYKEEAKKIATYKETLKQKVAKVTLSESVVQAVLKWFQHININREDVVLKLKNAQLTLGVNELVEETERLGKSCKEQIAKGIIIKSESGYYLGSLAKIVQAKEEERREKSTYHEPVKLKIPAAQIDEWEDKEYKYLSIRKVKYNAAGEKITPQEWVNKWGFEYYNGSFRMKKTIK